MDAGGARLPAELANSPSPILDNSRKPLLFRRALDGLARLFIYPRSRDLVSPEKGKTAATFRHSAPGHGRQFGDRFSSPDSLCKPGSLAQFVDRCDDAAGERASTGFVRYRAEWCPSFWVRSMGAQNLPVVRPGLFTAHLGLGSGGDHLSNTEFEIAWFSLDRPEAVLQMALAGIPYMLLLRNWSYVHDFASFFCIGCIAILGGLGLESVWVWIDGRIHLQRLRAST